eukprot:scaffold1525_cov128-Isochrysis_galbana.AAC.4
MIFVRFTSCALVHACPAAACATHASSHPQFTPTHHNSPHPYPRLCQTHPSAHPLPPRRYPLRARLARVDAAHRWRGLGRARPLALGRWLRRMPSSRRPGRNLDCLYLGARAHRGHAGGGGAGVRARPGAAVGKGRARQHRVGQQAHVVGGETVGLAAGVGLAVGRERRRRPARRAPPTVARGGTLE